VVKISGAIHCWPHRRSKPRQDCLACG